MRAPNSRSSMSSVTSPSSTTSCSSAAAIVSASSRSAARILASDKDMLHIGFAGETLLSRVDLLREHAGAAYHLEFFGRAIDLQRREPCLHVEVIFAACTRVFVGNTDHTSLRVRAR